MLSLVAADGPLAESRTLHVTFGGAEANTCVGLVRLGVSAGWVSRLGADVGGRRVHELIDGCGVNVRWVRWDPDRPTGLMLRDTRGTVVYYRGGSAASALGPGDLDPVPVEGARAVLVTGITALIGPDPQRAAIALLDRATGLRVVDPNIRPGLWGSNRAKELIAPIVERADVLLGGERELAELAELAGDLSGEALAHACRAFGPREVAVKRGERGAGVLDEKGEWHELVPEHVHDVDPVGAGDAFNAGYVAARLNGAPPRDALVQGARCGAEAAGRVGDAIAVR
jgi:2-dehydro-3-deoxygluconokinase